MNIHIVCVCIGMYYIYTHTGSDPTAQRTKAKWPWLRRSVIDWY